MLFFIMQPLAASFANRALAEDMSGTSTDEEIVIGDDGQDGIGNGDTTIETGGSELRVEAENDINTNDYGQADDDGMDIIPPDDSDTAENSVDGSGSEEITAVPDKEPEAGLADADDPAAASTPVNDSIASSTVITNDNEAELMNDIEGAGDTGENTIASSSGGSLIDTGDVGILSTADNAVNQNTTEALCESGCDNEAATTTVIDVKNDNDASTTNDVILSGNTGGNLIGTTSGAARITTGNIDILNIIVNFINSNFFGPGREFFINLFTHLVGALDLSGYDDGNSGAVAGDSPGDCGPDCIISVDNTGTSTINNNIDISADTGANTIASAGGPAVIETGDITILNDIANIANLNITGNDWFFAVVNVFDVLEGDLILPSLGSGADEVFDGAEAEAEERAQLIVANDNFADSVNNIDVIANTGDNTATDNIGTTTVKTGDAEVDVKAFNFVNYNFTGDGWRFVRINLFGTWNGSVLGLPDGYSYTEDEDGVTIYSDNFLQDIFNDAFAKLAVANENTATTTNNITIDANTGANGILHGGDGAAITTGDISIQNALLNFLNSNFTGNDWQFGLINIFGDWQGDLSFGRPELWLTESVSASKAGKGDYVTYTYLFGNRGDAVANDVKLADNFDERYLRMAEAGGGEASGGRVSWTIDNLPPNSQGSLSYTLEVRSDIPYGQNEADNMAIIGAAEGDRDESNNSAAGTVIVDGGSASGAGKVYAAASASPDAGGSAALPGLSIVKTNDAGGAVGPGDTVNYQIIIKNTGGAPLKDVLVSDIMTDEAGSVEVNRDFWDLDTLHNGEEADIDYTIEIGGGIGSGVYINQAIVEGYDSVRGKYISAVASSKIKVEHTLRAAEAGGPELTANIITRRAILFPGGEAEGEIIVTNNGHEPAQGVKIMVSLPRGLTFFNNHGNVNQWEIGVINPGEFKNIFFYAKADDSLSPGTYTTATVIKADNYEPIVINRDFEVKQGQGTLFAETAQIGKTSPKLTAGKPAVAELPIVAGVSDTEEVFMPLDQYFDGGNLNTGNISDKAAEKAAPVARAGGMATSKYPSFDFAAKLAIAFLSLILGFYSVAVLRGKAA